VSLIEMTCWVFSNTQLRITKILQRKISSSQVIARGAVVGINGIGSRGGILCILLTCMESGWREQEKRARKGRKGVPRRSFDLTQGAEKETEMGGADLS